MRMAIKSSEHLQVNKGSRKVLKEEASGIANSLRTVHNAVVEEVVVPEEKPRDV
jgi:hypothetical protein